MRKDVHLAALRAAGKVAFSVAFLAGCSSEGTSDDAVTDNAELRGGQTSDAGHASQTDSAAPSCGEAKFTCEDLVAAAFPTPDRGETKAVTEQVQTCCHDLLLEKGWQLEHRWDCCANLGSHNEGVAFACTPWGPPVPPPMKRVARLSAPMGVA